MGEKKKNTQMCFVLHKFLSAFLLEANPASPSPAELHLQSCSDMIMNYLWLFSLFWGCQAVTRRLAGAPVADTGVRSYLGTASVFGLDPQLSQEMPGVNKPRCCWTPGDLHVLPQGWSASASGPGRAQPPGICIFFNVRRNRWTSARPGVTTISSGLAGGRGPR